MKAAKLILAGAAVAAMIGGLGGCSSYYGRRTPTNYVDVRNQREKAAECVAAFEGDGRAPQVMTYDSETKTEVHVNQDGRNVNVTGQNAEDNTAMGMGGKVGGKVPQACTDADPIPGPAIPKSRGYKPTYLSH